MRRAASGRGLRGSRCRRLGRPCRLGSGRAAGSTSSRARTPCRRQRSRLCSSAATSRASAASLSIQPISCVAVTVDPRFPGAYAIIRLRESGNVLSAAPDSRLRRHHAASARARQLAVVAVPAVVAFCAVARRRLRRSLVGRAAPARWFAVDVLVFGLNVWFVWALLRTFNRQPRFRQTMTALLGAGVLLTCCRRRWSRSLDGAAAGSAKPGADAAGLLWFLLIVWSIDIGAFVFSRALERPYLLVHRRRDRVRAADRESPSHASPAGDLMRVHILGVCGTFMGGIAAIAKEAGHDVSGADQNVYPPMSTQLEALGIKLVDGYEAPIDAAVESVVVGNALSRGKPVVEALLELGQSLFVGPAVARRARAARQVGARRLGNARQDDDDEHARVDPRVRRLEARLPDRRRAGAISASRRGSAARSTSSSRPTSTTRRSSTSARSSSITGRAR